MLFVQVSYDLDALIGWRDRLRFEGPVYAGVMVLPSTAMARKLAASVPQLAAPTGVLERLDREPDAGVDIACELIDGIRNSGAFDGVHLIPVNRYRDIAARLESTRASAQRRPRYQRVTPLAVASSRLIQDDSTSARLPTMPI